MFFRILIKEIKLKIKSLTIFILFISIFLFYYTQFVGDIKREGVKPIPPRIDSSTGVDGVTLEDVIQYTYENMKADYESGNTLRMIGISMSYEELNKEQMQFLASAIRDMENMNYKIYNEYEAFLEKVDKALGGNTVYSSEYNLTYIIHNKTYNNDLERYTSILKEDKITNAYGRLFADYLGIAMGFFTVFITAFTLIKDKGYRMDELIYTTEISSYKYVLGKYLGDILVTSFMVLLTAGHATWMFHNYSKLTGDSISYTAFYEYSILWVVPTILFVTSFSYVLQLIFNNGIAPIIIQFFYWRYSISNLVSEGIQPSKYIIRFNKIVPSSEFQPYIRNICFNRVWIAIFSLALLLLAIKLWDSKRGDLHNGFHFRKKGFYT